jgi:succinate dehydrogenase iron-sulfur subunit
MPHVLLKIRRQDDPEDLPYWENFEIEVRPGMTVSSALEAIREQPVTAEGNPTTPVAWECSCLQGVCGACAILVDGRVRLACEVPLDGIDGPLALEPLSKFPVVRDLEVDRDRMLAALSHGECWVDLDGLAAVPGLDARISPEEAALAPFQDCILCGACSEACPQVNPRSSFPGAFLMSFVLPLNHHPIGRFGRGMRLAALGGRGGIADCAGAENCERVCPRGIPLVTATTRLALETAAFSLKRFFWG